MSQFKQKPKLLTSALLLNTIGLAAVALNLDLHAAAASSYAHQTVLREGPLGCPLSSSDSYSAEPRYQRDNSVKSNPVIPEFILAANIVCPDTPLGPCGDSKYRTINGTCNNLKNPRWGIPNARYNRLLPPKYSDGVHAPPVSVTGNKLPEARLISTVLSPDVPIDDPVYTLISMQWGQVISHDMSLGLGAEEAVENRLQCFSADGKMKFSEEEIPAFCFPMFIPKDDPFYSKFNQMILPLIRRVTDLDVGCSSDFDYASQLNSVTHFMDASLLYGSTPELSGQLRRGDGGRLGEESIDGRSFHPPNPNKTKFCDVQSEEEPCYQTGDFRSNQNPQLTVLLIMLLREHNRLAAALQHLNSHWDDETLYQEARRILIAEYQHINYYEWLPIFIGADNMKKHGLFYPGEKGHIEDYQEEVDPGVINEHATAAIRSFHSAIQGRIHMIGEDRHLNESIYLSDHINRPSILEEGENLDNLARGLSTQSQEKVDPFFTSEITNLLFKSNLPFGTDMRSIDIHRGRDHGLASYNDVRQLCGLSKATKFEDFGDYISSENIEKLSLLYAHPDDVDLTVGGLLEVHVKDTLAGPTFLCILTEQFYRTRVGDRYFFERGHSNPGAFTAEQLNEIRKSSVSRILCDNGDNISKMQPKGFEVISEKNPLVPCEDTNAIPAINLTLWKENSKGQEN